MQLNTAITRGAFSAVSIVPASTMVGATSSYSVGFTLRQPVPVLESDVRLQFEFAAGFGFAGAVTATSSAGSTLPQCVLSTGSGGVRLATCPIFPPSLLASYQQLPQALWPVSFTLTNVLNPNTAGSGYVAKVRVVSAIPGSSGVFSALDEGAVSTLAFSDKGTISGARTITPAPFVTFATATWTMSFTLARPVASNDVLEFSFPPSTAAPFGGSSVSLKGNGDTMGQLCPLAAGGSNLVARCPISSMAISNGNWAAGAAITLTLTSLIVPWVHSWSSTPLVTNFRHIDTLNFVRQDGDLNTNTPFSAPYMSSNSLTLSSYLTGDVSTMSITVTPVLPVAVGDKFVVRLFAQQFTRDAGGAATVFQLKPASSATATTIPASALDLSSPSMWAATLDTTTAALFSVGQQITLTVSNLCNEPAVTAQTLQTYVTIVDTAFVEKQIRKDLPSMIININAGNLVNPTVLPSNTAFGATTTYSVTIFPRQQLLSGEYLQFELFTGTTVVGDSTLPLKVTESAAGVTGVINTCRLVASLTPPTVRCSSFGLCGGSNAACKVVFTIGDVVNPNVQPGVSNTNVRHLDTQLRLRDSLSFIMPSLTNPGAPASTPTGLAVAVSGATLIISWTPLGTAPSVCTFDKYELQIAAATQTPALTPHPQLWTTPVGW